MPDFSASANSNAPLRPRLEAGKHNAGFPATAKRGIGAGIATLMWPGLTGIILLYLIAGWAIASGIFEIVGAIRLRKEIDDEWLLIASGVVSVIFGLLILANPGAGALGVAFAIGAFAVLFGVLQVALSMRLRKMAAVRI